MNNKVNSKIKISDYIAEYLKIHNITHVFGIVGAGNAHLFDSIYHLGFTQIICTHHEQAAIMAMIAYYRVTGKKSAVLLTTGAGSTNGTTGVVSAWMDSIPAVIIAGNENSKFTTSENSLRIWGVQGFDSVAMVSKVTKYAARLMNPELVQEELDKTFSEAYTDRLGPTWLEIPMNIQSSEIELEKIKKEVSTVQVHKKQVAQSDLEKIQSMLNTARRPLLWLGHGIRLAGAEKEMLQMVDKLQIPALVSWAGMDLLSFDHPLNMGSAGVYGQRAANFVLQNCDLLITIGTRLAIPQIGYDLSEFARDAKIIVNDIEAKEAFKHGSKITLSVVADAKDFIAACLAQIKPLVTTSATYQEWYAYCKKMQAKFPKVGPEHADKNGYINSYAFMEKLSEQLIQPQTIFVTDMGTALLSGHQVLNLKKGQRLITSTGLGEMGFGLPAAIGAALGAKNHHIICLNCDGGMMMNLQELQTMVHHQLPIKIFIFNNDGYLMIKHTQKALFKGRYAGTNVASGVSCPNYEKIATAFDLPYFKIKTWEDFKQNIKNVLELPHACICEVFMDPEQPLVPKLSLAIKDDGSLVSPPLEDLSPLISRETLKEVMLIPIHPKSKDLSAH